MKSVSISLTDQHVAAIEAEIASGDYASVSEVVRAALRDFLDRASHPGEQQMIADFNAMEAELAAGGSLLDTDDVRSQVRALLRE